MTRPDLSPGARAVLALEAAASGPPLEALTPAEARTAFAAGRDAVQLPGPPPDAMITLAGLSTAMWRGGTRRVILYLHGGGWVIGSPATHGAICARLAAACEAVVLAPDYRLAPEHPFPAAAEDAVACLAALPEAGFDGPIVVAGDSAGGNLAAVAALAAARDATLPQPVAQLLFYPNTSARQDHASYRRFATGFGLTAATMRWFRDHYLPDPKDIDDWRVSPLLAPIPASISPAYVALAGADILHDEGRAYADRLAAAGAEVQVDLWPDRLHGFLSMCRHDPAAMDAIAAAARWLDRTGIAQGARAD